MTCEVMVPVTCGSYTGYIHQEEHPMQLPELLDLAAVALAIPVTTYLARGTGRRAPRGAWLAPAISSALFFALSMVPVLQLGPFGFWAVHTRDLWGTQVWTDLVLAISTAWALLLPRARAAGVRALPWLPVVFATGSIGMLAFVARVLHAEEAMADRTPSSGSSSGGVSPVVPVASVP